MIRTAILAVAALIALSLNAEASQQHRAVQPICDNMDVMRLCAYQPNFLAGIQSIKVTMHRDQVTAIPRPRQPQSREYRSGKKD
jgi:hypothetical protein